MIACFVQIQMHLRFYFIFSIYKQVRPDGQWDLWIEWAVLLTGLKVLAP